MNRRILSRIQLLPAQSGFTLIELLIAMAITLVMIGAVVTLFANVSNSVRNRRAVVEMSGQLRHARNMLQQDLQGATCSGLTWQRPDENQGYIEIVEGPYSDRNPSPMLRDAIAPFDGVVDTADFDVALSLIPRNNAVTDYDNDGKIEDQEIQRYNSEPRSLVPSGLGDFDDVLMFTVRNEHEPFVGRVPKNDGTPTNRRVRPDATLARRFADWESATIESPLAEVVWYAVENPAEDANDDGVNDTDNFFGEPGLRTIYRRTLLIAPWINPYRFTSTTGVVDDTFQIGGTGPTFTAEPGLVRILIDDLEQNKVDEALACLIAFQERFDLSVRLEWDPLMGSDGRWKIVANTLGDLTKRENRYEHHFFRPGGQREYPYAAVSIGSEYQGNDVKVVSDPEVPVASAFRAATANLISSPDINNLVANYSIEPDNLTNPTRQLPVRPFAFVDETSGTLATARAMLNDEGEVVRVVHGLVPLSGDRRGEDVMLTDALGFDLRVYDPGALLYGVLENPAVSTSPLSVILEPGDPAWAAAYRNDLPDPPPFTVDLPPGQVVDQFIGQGAYVDLGYGFGRNVPRFKVDSTAIFPWFFTARALSDVFANSLAPGYAVYDTWSFHYENNGLNEDHDFDANNSPMIDEGTNGLDDRDPRIAGATVDHVDHVDDVAIGGPDDVGERETVPPYDKPLRGVQVVLRLYERDSRQVRQVSVNQHFVPE